MGLIPQEIIDQILDRTDIVEVLSGYIQLKKAGRNFKACCPFHNEKTPSFVVSPDKQIYHCFGCHAGGNVVNFVMKYENMEFPEAARMLASKSGVDIPEGDGGGGSGEQSLSSRIYEINKLATDFYQNVLRSEKGKKALEYLKRRGIDQDTINEFRLGYAPDEWESLRSYCVSKKIDKDLLRKAGVTIPSERGRNDYDRFRNRIMFPIFNERGNIAAFGGRVMDDSLPKYINSPETIVYSKSNVLYGLNFSRRSVREKGYIVIAEGYMDVIMPYQHGVTNIVAASGTALTSRQASMMKKYTDTAVMVFDSDQAGEAASLRGLDILIETGMNVKIATLPVGDDPDSFIKKNGKDRFEKELQSSKDLFDYKLDLLIGKLGIRDIGGITDEMLPTISKVGNAVVQSDYLTKLAERLGVHEASLRYELGKVKPDYSYHYESEIKASGGTNNCRSSEIHLLGLAIVDRQAYEKIKNELGIDKFRDRSARSVISIVSDLFEGGVNEISPGKLLSRLESDAEAKNTVMQAIAKADITQDRSKAVSDCIFCVRRENRAEELKILSLKLKKAQEARNGVEVDKLVAMINRIHKEKVA